MSLTGRTLSHYEVLGELSRGGMGIVYRARDSRLRREVALKVLPPELVADPERKRRFVLEARAAAQLDHPNIGVVHEVGEADGQTFIAMGLIGGEKLSDTLLRGPLPLDRALDVAIGIAEGLAKAHDKGVVHRDLKPANVMLDEDGRARIIDFGLAPSRRTRRRAAAVAAGVAALAASGVLLMRPDAPSPSAAARLDSVAILPLRNVSGDPEQEYFADGMTEALIHDLGQVSSLRVISPRTRSDCGSLKPEAIRCQLTRSSVASRPDTR